MKIVSFEYVTCNEAGLEEVTFEFEVSFWRRMFRREPFKRTFELWITGWRDKETGEYATVQERIMIVNEIALCCASWPSRSKWRSGDQ